MRIFGRGRGAPSHLLLHGFTQGPESWAAAMAPLGDAVRALAVSLPGHGLNPGPVPESFAETVEALAAVLASIAARPVHLVGYSLGARLGLGLLVAHPELFSRATLIGARPGLPEEAARAARRREDEARAHLLEGSGLEAFLAAWEAMPLWASQSGLPDEVRARHRALRRANTAQGLAASLRATGLGVMPDLMPALQRLERPVTFVAGALDGPFVRAAEAMAEAAPHAEAQMIPGAGHDVLLEAPETLAALLGETA